MLFDACTQYLVILNESIHVMADTAQKSLN